jgi:uncharacterized protein YaiI (UPF0178 family)
MRIWIDGDACPNTVKAILFKAADRRQVETTVVANHFVRTPNSRWIHCLQVPQGFDMADATISERLEAGDLVITADVPLADEVIGKGALALNPRGTLYDAENIKSHLARRDMREELRASGLVSGGPPALSEKDIQQFANALDRIITRALRSDA